MPRCQVLLQAGSLDESWTATRQRKPLPCCVHAYSVRLSCQVSGWKKKKKPWALANVEHAKGTVATALARLQLDLTNRHKLPWDLPNTITSDQKHTDDFIGNLSAQQLDRGFHS